MTGIMWLACIGLFFWCGALSRRVAGASAGCCLGADGDERADVDEQLGTLAHSHQRMDTELYDRVTELEERLDFTERMLAQANARTTMGNA